MEKRIEERAVGVAAAGMHDETRRLVHDQQGVVFEHDVQGDVLRDGANVRAGAAFFHRQGLAACELVPGRRHHGVVDPHESRLDPSAEPGARVLGQELRRASGRGGDRRRRRVPGSCAGRCLPPWARRYNSRLEDASHATLVLGSCSARGRCRADRARCLRAAACSRK
jgi:hypothetical protein